ncbi:hypothetical protein [Gordonia crocea]|uniref:Uncharacterized protein n=1 Tax=Gordonia crocea TaxID=589162 RepID=A0A7M3SVP9_9ACTN|nr:hypothetical protein [Gordonia crocea]GED96723.1 hypothetical protein nbrc107697_07620 [Gordonia crocea]
MVRQKRVALAVVTAVCVAGGLAGCADALTGGAVSFSSYPPVSTLRSMPPLATVLPAGFPAAVPVVGGRYRRIHSPTLGDRAYVLAVGDTGPSALEHARTRLLDAGFIEQDFVGQRTYIGRGHTVTVASVDAGFGFSLVYTVLPTADVAGLGSIPNIDLSDLFG